MKRKHADVLDVNGLAVGRDRWGYLLCKHKDRLKNCNLCMGARTQAYRKRKPDKALQHSLSKFGVSVEWYRKKEKEQKGLCAMCRKPERRKRNGKLMRLAVDHNHVTGEARALLCSRCNLIVGIVELHQEIELANKYIARFDNPAQGF